MTVLYSIPRRSRIAVVAVFCAATVLLTAVLVCVPRTAAVSGSAERLLPIYCTDRGDNIVSLTFDAAWGDEDTPLLIEILERYNVKATFFVVGEWVDRCPESVKALAEAGHEVMNHSDTHPHLPALSHDEIRRELNACNDKIETITGVRPSLLRVPYGDYSDTVLTAAESLGMYTIQWDVDSLDWKDLSAAEITDRVLSKVQSGSIVLFHNAALHTPEALPEIIETLKARGFSFCKVSDMIYKDHYTINHEGRQCRSQKD